MRILLDHNLDWRLWELLQPHEVITTRRMHWDRYENGNLLNVAQDKFDILLTTDANLYHQNKVANYELAVIVLRAYRNSYQALAPLIPEVLQALETIQPGEVVYVYADEKLKSADQRKGKEPSSKT
jgi:predicted nuclease of predicted toxin-antitoxin system